MNKMIFTFDRWTIRIRDAVWIILLLLLFFFCMQSCENQTVQKKKEDRISDHCAVMKENINTLNELLMRSNFCDATWFYDLEDYMSRLKEQNSFLSVPENTAEMAEKQKKLLDSLYQFQEIQTEETVNQMEEALKEYRECYHMRCEIGEKENEAKE